MTAKKEVRTREAVLAAGEQLQGALSDLSRARARRDFVALATSGSRAAQVPVQKASRLGAATRWASGIAVAAAALLALRFGMSSRAETSVNTQPKPTPMLAPPAAQSLTAERIVPGAHVPVHTGDRVHSAHNEPTGLRFSDGTEVSLSKGAQVTLATMGAEGAALRLEAGTLSAKVVHQGVQTAWDFLAGPFEVHVVGTAFELSWDPASKHAQLHMQEGIVHVEGCGMLPRNVRAPEQVQLACESDPALRALAPATAPAIHAPAPVSPPSLVAGSNQVSATQEPTMDSLMAEGAWDKAYGLVRADFEARVRSASADEALRLGDLARMAHQDGDAMLAYRSSAERGKLTLAWLELGKVQLRTGRASDAKRSADHALTLSHGPAREDAAMMGVEAALAEGKRSEAETRAARYLAEYPEGLHAKRAQHLLAKETAAKP